MGGDGEAGSNAGLKAGWNVSETKGTGDVDGTTTSKELNSNSFTASVVVGLKISKKKKSNYSAQ